MKVIGINPTAVKVAVRVRVTPVDKDWVENLAESITTNGQQVPGIVTDNGDGTYTLNDGEHRLEAIKLINSTIGDNEKPYEFQAVVTKANDKQAVVNAIIGNTHKPMNIFDLGDACQKLLDLGMKQVEIASKLGKSEATISQALAARKVSKKVQKMVLDGDLEQDAAILIADTEDKALQQEIIEEAIRHRTRLEDYEKRKMVKELKKEAEATAEEAKAAKERAREASIKLTELKKKGDDVKPETLKAAEKELKTAQKEAERLIAEVEKKKEAAASAKPSKKKISTEDVKEAKAAKGVSKEPVKRSLKKLFATFEAFSKDQACTPAMKILMGRIEGFCDGDYNEKQLFNSFVNNCK